MPRNRTRAALTILIVSVALAAQAAWLHPVDGDGYFTFTCDAVNLSRDDGGVDLVVMISVPHRELTFVEDAGLQRARVRARVSLTGLDGRTATNTVSHRLSARSVEEANSLTLRQEFTVVLPAVTMPTGTLTVRVDDLNRRRPGLSYLGTDERAFAQAQADWYALPARETAGLAVGDAVFMAHAPIREWEIQGRPTPAGGGGPWDFIHPGRRYGLEVEALQLYVTVAPPRRIEDRQRAAERSLLVRIESDGMDFALVDTIVTTDAVRRALAAGHEAALYWEMDAGGLPPGSYRLAFAPLDDVGRGLLTTFDVVWSLAQLATPHERVLGEGRTVLVGDQLAAFEAASRTEQGLILERFWRDLDPTPQDPYNEAAAEFRRRVDHVQRFLGGFGAEGALDPRGRVYLLLGRPNAVREEAMPINENAVNAARDLVFDRFLQVAEGSQGTAPWTSTDYTDAARVAPPGAGLTAFVPYTYMADVIATSNRTSDNTRSFLFWRYDEAGDQLFLNSYTGLGGGLRFLFIDQTGLGQYKLDSSNARMPSD